MKRLRLPILLLACVAVGGTGRASTPPSVAWTRNFTHPSHDPVALGPNGALYATANDGTHALVALDAAGQVLWGYQDPSTRYSSPVIGDTGDLYSITEDRRLVALSHQGALRWQRPLTGRVYHLPVLGRDGTLYFGDDGGFLHAVRNDGSVAWSVTNGAAFNQGSPAIRSDGAILIGDSSGGFHCYGTNGVRRWTVSYPGYVATTPAVGDDGRIRVLYSTGVLRCLDENGTRIWEFNSRTAPLGGSPAVDAAGNTYFGTERGGLYAVGADGRQRWNRAVPGGVLTTPLLTASGTVVVAGYERQVLFYGTNGVLARTIPTELRLNSSPTLSPSGLLLAASGDGQLTALQTDLRPTAAGWPMDHGTPRLTGRARARPTVTLVQPDPTRLYRTDEGIPLAVEAASDNGPILRVEFLAGTNLVATSTQPPFSAQWPAPPPGPATLRARVFDEAGARAESGTVAVRVVDPRAAPLFLRGPAETTTNAGPAFSTSVETLSLTPTTYEWFIDGRPVAGLGGPEFSVNGTSPNNSGVYTVVARNAFGATTSSPSVMTFLVEPEVFWTREMATRNVRPSIGPDGRLCVQVSNGLLGLDRAGTLQWAFPGWMNDGIPIAGDGSLVVNQEGRILTALDAAGRTLWRAESASGATGAARDRRGELYLATADGFLERRSPEGTLRWRTAIGSAGPTTPMISTDSRIVLGAVDGRIRAFSPDGAKVWERESGMTGVRGGAIGPGGVLVFTAGNRLLALRPDGSVLWQADLPGSAGLPVVAPDGAVHLGMLDQPSPSSPPAGRVSVYESDGRLRWSRPVDSPALQSGALAADGTFFIPSGPTLLAWNRNGTLRFRYTTEGNNLSAPLIGFDGSVYLTDGFAHLMALRGTLPMPGNGWPCQGRDVRCRSDASSDLDPDTFFFPTASNGFDGPVSAIHAVGDGTLYVGGQFQIAGGLPASRIAGWNGTNWFRIGNGFTGEVSRIVRWGTNVVVLASSDPRGGVVPFPFLWDGTTWRGLHLGLRDGMGDLVVHNGTLLGITEFLGNGGFPQPFLARWTGSEWVPSGNPLPNSGLTRLASGPSGLHASVGGAVHRFDGTHWSRVGGFFNEQVQQILDSPQGLFVSGAFTLGGAERGRVARWNGTSWVPLGPGLNPAGGFFSYAGPLATEGTNLLVGGFFALPDSTNAISIARWNGSSWSPVRASDFYLGLEDNQVRTLAHADGRLYVGGNFLRTGDRRDLHHFAVLDGAWRSLGTPVLTVDPQLGLYLFNLLGRPYIVESSEDLATWRERFRYQALGEPVRVPDPGGDSSDRRFYRIVVP
jgi:sugar lactone lactonase YvrE